MLPALKVFVQAGKSGPDDFLQRQQPGPYAVFRQREDGLLGAVQQLIGFLLGLKAFGNDVVGGVDQVPQQRLLLDDASVVLDGGDARHAVHQRGKISRAAGGFQLPRPLQVFVQSDQVNRPPLLAQRHHAGENLAMAILIEIPRLQRFNRRVEGLVVQQDGAEHRTLGLQVVGKLPFQG